MSSSLSNLVTEENDEPAVVIDTNFQTASAPQNDFAKDLAMIVETMVAAGSAADLKTAGHGQRVNTIRYVNPFLLAVREGWNARDYQTKANQEHILQLARTFVGGTPVKEPLTVWPEDGRLIIRNGHMRYFAVMYAINHLGAKIETVPVKLDDPHASEEDILVEQIVRNMGKDFDPLELGSIARRLMGFGWTEQKIADKSGYTVQRVKQILALHAGATPAVREMIVNGQVTATLAQNVLATEGSPATAEQVLRQTWDNARAAGKSHASPKHLPETAKLRARKAAPKRDVGGGGSDVTEPVQALPDIMTESGEEPSATVFAQDNVVPAQDVFVRPGNHGEAAATESFEAIVLEAGSDQPGSFKAGRDALLSSLVRQGPAQVTISCTPRAFDAICRSLGVSKGSPSLEVA